MDSVWVFHGEGGFFTSGVFSSFENADRWINKYLLTGVLTQYPLDEGIYDWAITNEYFDVKKDHESSPEFIQKFTAATQEHFHYENGIKE